MRRVLNFNKARGPSAVSAGARIMARVALCLQRLITSHVPLSAPPIHDCTDSLSASDDVVRTTATTDVTDVALECRHITRCSVFPQLTACGLRTSASTN